MIFSEIKQIRKLREMSQTDLAIASGVPKSTISRIESGDINPTSATLEKIAAALKCRWRLITD